MYFLLENKDIHGWNLQMIELGLHDLFDDQTTELVLSFIQKELKLVTLHCFCYCSLHIHYEPLKWDDNKRLFNNSLKVIKAHSKC